MIDELMGVYAVKRYSAPDLSYTPDQAIESVTLLNEHAKNLTVLFPPWRGGDVAYRRLAKKLIGLDSAVLLYKFSTHILEPNVERVLDSFTHIQNEVTAHLDQLCATNSYENIQFIASSLGNVSMGLVMRAFPYFNEATFVVGGSDLAKCVWHGTRTRSIRGELEQQGYNENTLVKDWAEIAPEKAAEVVPGKRIHIIKSETDKIIPSTYQQELAIVLAHDTTQIDIVSKRTGHLATVANFCF